MRKRRSCTGATSAALPRRQVKPPVGCAAPTLCRSCPALPAWCRGAVTRGCAPPAVSWPRRTAGTRRHFHVSSRGIAVLGAVRSSAPLPGSSGVCPAVRQSHHVPAATAKHSSGARFGGSDVSPEPPPKTLSILAEPYFEELAARAAHQEISMDGRCWAGLGSALCSAQRPGSSQPAEPRACRVQSPPAPALPSMTLKPP